MGILEGFMWGVFGGFVAEILGLFKLRHEKPGTFPDWLNSPFYWLITIAMIFAGGGLVVVYLESQFALNALLSVNIGASAPLILGTLVSQAPNVPMRNVD